MSTTSPAFEGTLQLDRLEPPRVLPHSLPSDGLLPDTPRFLSFAHESPHESAREAAEVDPGIMIIPDRLMDAQIIHIVPPENVDPNMIPPRESGRSGDRLEAP